MGSEIPDRTFQPHEHLFTRRGACNTTKESLAEANDQAHALTLQALESVKDDEWKIVAWTTLIGTRC